MKPSKIKQALALIESGSTPHAAALVVGLAPGNVYRELKRQAAKKPAAVSADASDPEAVLRQWIAEGRADEVGLIVGRLFLLLEEVKAKA